MEESLLIFLLLCLEKEIMQPTKLGCSKSKEPPKHSNPRYMHFQRAEVLAAWANNERLNSRARWQQGRALDKKGRTSPKKPAERRSYTASACKGRHSVGDPCGPPVCRGQLEETLCVFQEARSLGDESMHLALDTGDSGL